MSDLVLHPTGIPTGFLLGFLGFTNVQSHLPFGHVHMFAVIMVAEEEKTEDCVIVTIASNAT